MKKQNRRISPRNRGSVESPSAVIARGGQYVAGGSFFQVFAQDERHVILIHQQIGKDWWSEDGVSSEEFANALQRIPRDREILVRINSPGGNVHAGLAIYTHLAERRDKVTVIVDGAAASIASVIAMAGKDLVMPKSSILMIHNPWSRVQGDKHVMTKAAEMLQIHGDAIASIYEGRTGLSRAEVEEIMDKETWMTGETALQKKFATRTNEDAVAAHITKEILDAAPEAIRVAVVNASRPQSDSGSTPTKQIMTRAHIIALLRKNGVQVDDKATDEQLNALLEQTLQAHAASHTNPNAGNTPGSAQPEPAAAQSAAATPATPTAPGRSDPATPQATPASAPQVDVAALQAQVREISARYNSERRERLTRDVDTCVAENRIPANQRDAWLNRVMADEAVLTDLRALPSRPPGVDAIHSIRVTAEDPRAIAAELGRIRTRVSDRFSPQEASASAHAFASEYGRVRDRLIPVWNTNTIPAELKRQAILQEIMRAFANRLIALRAFSTVHVNVPLEGTDKVNVPFYPLETAASTVWNGANGYVMGNSTTEQREVTINQRRYQPLRWASDEWNRQPYLNILQLSQMKAEKLATDVWNNILSVVTLANFGVHAHAGAASGFDSDDVVDIKLVCDNAQWPEIGRSLILKSEYDAALLKDDAIKDSAAFGGAEAIRQGRIPTLFGFNYYPNPNIPANAENLVGMAVFPSSILVATAPILPTQEVRAQLSSYEVVVDPQIGIAFEYRRWGNADMDQSRAVIECNYGFARGNQAALKRILSVAPGG